MREQTPQTVYLKDYTPPDYWIETVDLTFELEEEDTRVISRLSVVKNPQAPAQKNDLELNGEALILESLALDGRTLKAREFQLSEECLVIPKVPERFVLEIVTRTNPKTNTALEGLYLSKDMLCTQCEAQGFRRITYFLDRPDVMARYRTKLIADKSRYPVLLSNGNPVQRGELENNRHWVQWEDPFKKPCYLFALVAGKLACLEDKYTTASGREIALKIYVEEHNLDKCAHALRSLQNAMRWDEETYGREYDLDLYMIVAVDHFNMGAMENKGLNIFNTKYVLARPDTATDSDYEHIEGVIAHEYFHNWTGNRITCRDWFQLSLKEGLTVFRDQQFSADRTSTAVKRISDANLLRTRQFAEDSGPLAHPVRPESYMEINNFYTLTVYEKGAEVVHMLHTLLGPEGFRRGTDLYFQRHDGQAVTCDDFVKAMEDANRIDLAQFRRWYTQAGTPELKLEMAYDPNAQVLTLTARQSCPATPGQPHKEPFYIPFAMGLIDPEGKALPLQLEGEGKPAEGPTRVLHLTEKEHVFRFIHLPQKPILSPLRGFSAPLKLHLERSLEDLAFLLSHDSDAFNRWDAGQELAGRIILEGIDRLRQGQGSFRLPGLFIDAYRALLDRSWDDLSYLSLLLSLPSESYLSEKMTIIDVEGIHQSRQSAKRALAESLPGEFHRLYRQHHQNEAGRFDQAAIGRRRLKNTCLDYLTALDNASAHQLSIQQFEEAKTMTDQIAALAAIVNSHNTERSRCLEAFYRQWKEEALVIDKWFTLQATCQLPGTLETVKNLLEHPAFDIKNPNRVRSLIGAFSQANPVNFHAADGSGYEFLAHHVIALNALNPQIAARLLSPLTAWRRYDEQRQRSMKRQLEKIASAERISKDVYEVVSKSLA